MIDLHTAGSVVRAGIREVNLNEIELVDGALFNLAKSLIHN